MRAGNDVMCGLAYKVQNYDEFERRVAPALWALLRAGALEPIDCLLNAIDCVGAEDGTPAGTARGYYVGMYVGFLRDGPMRERESFRDLVERYRAALAASSSEAIRALDADAVLGLTESGPGTT